MFTSFQSCRKLPSHGSKQFYAIDTPMTTNEAQRWGLTESMQALSTGLLAKVSAIQRTTVSLTARRGRTPSGSTELTGWSAGAETNLTNLNRDAVLGWLKDATEPQFTIKVEVLVNRDTLFPGTVVEILNHELSGHAEPFADFLTAVLTNQEGVWESEEQQHSALKNGLPRYQLIAARYLTTCSEDDKYRYKTRASQDYRATPKLPKGV
jgi:hypothetical protein